MGECGMLLQYWGEGNLKKLGGMGGRTQQTRWFELKGQGLRYYSESPRGAVDLSRPVEITEEGTDSFTITGDHLPHPYTLIASDESEKQRWIRLIKRAISGPKVGYTEGRLKSFEGEREALIATSEQLAKEIHENAAEMEQHKQELNREKSELSESLSEAKKLAAAAIKEKESLQEAINDLKRQNDNLLADVRNQQANNNQKAEAIQSLQSEKNGLQSSVTDKTTTIEELRRELADCKKRQLEEQNNHQNKLQQITDRFNDDIQTAKVAAADEERKKLENNKQSELKKIRDDHDQEIERMNEALAEAERASTASSRENVTLKSRVMELKNQMDTLQEENHLLVNEAEQAERRLELQLMLSKDAQASTSPEVSLSEQVQPETDPATEMKKSTNEGSPTSPSHPPIFRIRGDRGLIVREGEDTSSGFITQLPKGSSVQICHSHLHNHARRVKITKPVEGWVSLTTETGIELAVRADIFEPSAIQEYQPGSLVETAIVKEGVLTGWVHGRVLSSQNDISIGPHYGIHILKTPLSLALGVSEVSMNSVLPTHLRPRSPKWAICDVPDHLRLASSAAYDHCEGFGCNRGMLCSEFCWVSKEGDNRPTYTIDVEELQPVSGLVLAGYFAMGGLITDYEVSSTDSIDTVCTPVLLKHIDSTSSRSSSIISDGQMSVDFSAPVTVSFSAPVIARYIRLTVLDWVGKDHSSGCCLRVGLVLDASEPLAPQTIPDEYVSLHESSNVWKLETTQQNASALLDNKVKAIEQYKSTVDAQRLAIEAERADYKIVRDQLAKTNTILSSNIHTLKEKGMSVQRKNVALMKDDLVGLVVPSGGVTIVGIKDDCELEIGNKICEIDGREVLEGDDVNSILEGIDSDRVTIAVEYEAVSNFAQNLFDERNALRQEIKRQHQSIQSLEAAVAAAASRPRTPPPPAKQLSPTKSTSSLNDSLRRLPQQLPHRSSKKPTAEEVVF
eukprot:TRINITY_DN30924_c0_g1_i1.p1 TRINITY_DN30924_c0_g1~~TRINITY_DN30924_c0_g1_i1.p1  ORF type:complete len:980 (+),score=251.45 TRINITY_DN30924_c0_g1_i1:50-2941(+)